MTRSGTVVLHIFEPFILTKWLEGDRRLKSSSDRPIEVTPAEVQALGRSVSWMGG
ncbi:MAG TPA: hypothetical protein V6D27_15055 [Vampirovibrionales bacterium]